MNLNCWQFHKQLVQYDYHVNIYPCITVLPFCYYIKLFKDTCFHLFDNVANVDSLGGKCTQNIKVEYCGLGLKLQYHCYCLLFIMI